MPDEIFCADMGVRGAVCFHTLSDEQTKLLKSEWDKKRFGMICETPDTFAEWKSIIDKFCETTKDCDFGQVQQIFDKVNNTMDR